MPLGVYLVGYELADREATRHALRGQGVQILEKLPANHYLVKADGKSLSALEAAVPSVTTVSALRVLGGPTQVPRGHCETL